MNFLCEKKGCKDPVFRLSKARKLLDYLRGNRTCGRLTDGAVTQYCIFAVQARQRTDTQTVRRQATYATAETDVGE